MGAIRAEMPGVSIAFASIGMGHGVFVLFRKDSGLTSEPWVKKHIWETGENQARAE